jgi:hypothetical protein
MDDLQRMWLMISLRVDRLPNKLAIIALSPPFAEPERRR